jgi:CRISPR-associated protein Cmr1
MEKVKFKCEIITPMFVYGADTLSPELRAPSIKGVLRFWWRALNCLSVDEMKKREAQIFGGSGDDEGKSKVRVRVSDNLLVERSYKLKTKGKGIAYLLYSQFLGSDKKFKKFISDKNKFYITFSSNDLNALRHAVASFWALSFFGGLGSRARRGGGNFNVVEITEGKEIVDDTGLNFFIEGNFESTSRELKTNLEKAKKIINEGSQTQFVSEYSNLSIARFIISKEGFNSWKDALNSVGEEFLEFRNKHKSYIFETGAFGLPVRHRKTTVIANDPKNDEKINRRSSPLIFRVIKIKDKYYWILLRLAGEFLPEGAVVLSQKNKKTQKPDFALFDEFWNEMKKDNIEQTVLPDELNSLRKKIVNELSPKKIVLFGSRARGDFKKNSDIDIAVDTQKNIEMTEISEAVDIVNINKVPNEFKEKIEKEGIVI